MNWWLGFTWEPVAVQTTWDHIGCLGLLELTDTRVNWGHDFTGVHWESDITAGV